MYIYIYIYESAGDWFCHLHTTKAQAIVLNGSTASKASAKQSASPVNKAVSELAQPPIMKL